MPGEESSERDETAVRSAAVRPAAGRLRGRLVGALTLLVCAGFFANVWFFARKVANPLLQLDDWRYLGMYRPFLLGDGPYDWSILWRDHHPLPVNAFLFIANARWLDLDMSHGVLVGVLFLPVFALLLFRAYLRSARDLDVSRNKVWLAFLFLIPLTFTLNVHRPFTWSLVGLGFIPNAAILLLYVMFDESARAGAVRRQRVQLFVLTSVLLALFPDRVLLAVPLILSAGVFMLLVARSARRVIAGSMLAIVLGLAAKMAVFELLDLGPRGGFSASALPQLMTNVVQHPLGYVGLFEIGIGTGFFNLRRLNGFLGLAQEGLWPAHVAVLLYLSALVLFFRRGMWRRSLVPVLLMSYPLLAIAGIGAYRYDPEVDSYWKGGQPRHIVMLMFASIGACWIFVLAFLERKEELLASLASRGALACAVLLVLTQLLFIQRSWQNSGVHPRVWRGQEKVIRAYAQDPSRTVPGTITGSNFPEPFTSSLTLLREQNLNLYSKDW